MKLSEGSYQPQFNNIHKEDNSINNFLPSFLVNEITKGEVNKENVLLYEDKDEEPLEIRMEPFVFYNVLIYKFRIIITIKHNSIHRTIIISISVSLIKSDGILIKLYEDILPMRIFLIILLIYNHTFIKNSKIIC